MMKTEIRLEDGKYTVSHENGTNFHALRYGDKWRDLTGDGLVLAMAHRIEELEKQAEALNIALNPRRWTQAHHSAWNKTIPNTTDAFEKLRELAVKPTIPLPEHTFEPTTFDEWLKTVCFQKPMPEAYDLAKHAWEVSRKTAQVEHVPSLLEELNNLPQTELAMQAQAGFFAILGSKMPAAQSSAVDELEAHYGAYIQKMYGGLTEYAKRHTGSSARYERKGFEAGYATALSRAQTAPAVDLASVSDEDLHMDASEFYAKLIADGFNFDCIDGTKNIVGVIKEAWKFSRPSAPVSLSSSGVSEHASPVYGWLERASRSGLSEVEHSARTMMAYYQGAEFPEQPVAEQVGEQTEHEKHLTGLILKTLELWWPFVHESFPSKAAENLRKQLADGIQKSQAKIFDETGPIEIPEFWNLRIGTIQRAPDGFVEYMHVYNADGKFAQTVYRDPKPRQFWNEEDRQLHAKATVTNEMVGRFLGWRLPNNFYPDCFVSFDREKALQNNSWPIGTNLLDSEQVKTMLEHVLGIQTAVKE